MSGRSYLARADALSLSFLFVLFSVLARVSFLARAAAAQPQVITSS